MSMVFVVPFWPIAGLSSVRWRIDIDAHGNHTSMSTVLTSFPKLLPHVDENNIIRDGDWLLDVSLSLLCSVSSSIRRRKLVDGRKPSRHARV